MPDPTLTNPTYTLIGKSAPLADGLTVKVGQSIGFDATLAGGGSLTVHLRGPGKATRGVAWAGKAWDVLPSDVGPRVLRLEHRRNKASVGELLVAVNVVAASDADPLPPTQPGNIVEPDAPKLTGKMAVGLVDAARLPWATLKPYLSPWCKSIGVWAGCGDFKTYKRDDDFAHAIGYEQAGVSVVWRVADTGVTPAQAANAPAWIVTMIRDLIGAYDADERTRGRRVRIQYLNEPDLQVAGHPPYWRGTIAEYVTSLAAVRKAIGRLDGPDRVELIAAGWSWNIASLEAVGGPLAAACDTLALHGYPRLMSDAAFDPYRRLVALAKRHGKATISTEFSPGYGTARTKRLEARDFDGAAKVLEQWARDWPIALTKLESIGIDEAQIFNAFDISTTNSAGAMFVRNGAKAIPTGCYATVAKAVSP